MRPPPPPRRPKHRQDLAFGKCFTDHMLVCEHDARLGGWAAPRIVPFPASADDDDHHPQPQRRLLPGASSPALQALHYGGSCFEGMKAYPGPDGRPRLFRPELNARRFARSAERLGLAPWSPRELLACLGALVEKDAAWLPGGGGGGPPPGHALYLRPFAYASEPGLGVHRTSRTAVAVVMCPVGPYFRAAPVSLLLDERRVRAWPGGTGSYKICGNYAPTVVPQAEAAAAHGCAQVLYTMPAAALLTKAAAASSSLPPSQSSPSSPSSPLVLPAGLELSDRVVGECGAMNVFFVLEHEASADGSTGRHLELATPPLDDGTILPGVTRQSALELARAWAAEGAGPGGGGSARRLPLRVRERHVTVRELRAAAASGRLREVFGTGTACVVQPVAELVLEEGSGLQGGGGGGGGGGGAAAVRLAAPGSSTAAAAGGDAPPPLWARLGAALADIQYGRVPGGHPWSVRASDLLLAAP